jgi:hypothetical protein
MAPKYLKELCNVFFKLFSNVVDPGSALALIGWIQIRIKKARNEQKFKCFDVLDVLFLGLKASPVAWMSFMDKG